MMKQVEPSKRHLVERRYRATSSNCGEVACTFRPAVRARDRERRRTVSKRRWILRPATCLGLESDLHLLQFS